VNKDTRNVLVRKGNEGSYVGKSKVGSRASTASQKTRSIKSFKHITESAPHLETMPPERFNEPIPEKLHKCSSNISIEDVYSRRSASTVMHSRDVPERPVSKYGGRDKMSKTKTRIIDSIKYSSSFSYF
jgi:hypothetical protein